MNRTDLKPCCTSRSPWISWRSFADGGVTECRDCGATVTEHDINLVLAWFAFPGESAEWAAAHLEAVRQRIAAMVGARPLRRPILSADNPGVALCAYVAGAGMLSLGIALGYEVPR